MMNDEKFVMIGATALRKPDGTFHPAIPLYVKVDQGAVDPDNGFTEGEKELYDDIGAALMPFYKKYADGVKIFEKETR